MKTRTILLVGLALICGISAALGVSQLLGQSGKNVKNAEQGETVAVVVASETIPRGTVIADTAITTRNWPKELVPSGA